MPCPGPQVIPLILIHDAGDPIAMQSSPAIIYQIVDI